MDKSRIENPLFLASTFNFCNNKKRRQQKTHFLLIPQPIFRPRFSAFAFVFQISCTDRQSGRFTTVNAKKISGSPWKIANVYNFSRIFCAAATIFLSAGRTSSQRRVLRPQSGLIHNCSAVKILSISLMRSSIFASDGMAGL